MPKANADNTLNVTLKLMGAGTQIADASMGGNFSNGGSTLNVPAGAIDTGGAKTAAATIHITNVNLANDTESASLPGGLTATAGSQTGLLDVSALVNVTVEVNGSSTDLNTGTTATLRLRVAAGSTLNAGDTVPLWYFDVEASAWYQSGTGTVIQSGGSLYIEGTISHFGWWCGATIETGLFTIRGHVYDAVNQPVENALIIANGVNYHGGNWTVSAQDGSYAINVLPNAAISLKLILPGAYYVCDTLSITSGAAGSALENQDLAPSFTSCIHGYVTEEDGVTPIEGVQVYSSTGGNVLTAVDGSFCMLAPGSTNVAVYTLGRPPVFAFTPASATCEAGNGAEVLLSVKYPKDGDRLGYVFGSLRSTTIPFGGTRTYLSTSALFYSGFKGNQFAPYDVDMPMDTAEVYTAQYASSLNWNAITLGLQLAFDIGFDINEMFGLDDGEVPSIDKIGALDAGSPATASNGTTSFNLLRPLDFFYPFEGNGSLTDLGYAMLEPWMGGFYFQQDLWNSNFAAGNVITLAWPGGMDMGPFTAQTTLPGALTVTAPTDLSGILNNDALTNGLTITWNTQGAGSYVTFLIESIVVDGFLGPVRVGGVLCKAADDGQFVVPAETLAQLPIMGNSGSQVNYLFAKRHTITETEVPLTRGNGSGYVVTAMDSQPVKWWSLDIRVKK